MRITAPDDGLQLTVTTTAALPVLGPGLSDFRFPRDRTLFVVGDVHGQKKMLATLLDAMGRLPASGHRHLVFLGDLIDRGPDSLGAIRLAVLEGAARAKADSVTFLPGNHELLMVGALQGVATPDFRCWTLPGNGGAEVLNEAAHEAGLGRDAQAADKLKALHGLLPANWLDAMRQGPKAWKETEAPVLCVHAGVHPKRSFSETLAQARRSHLKSHVTERHWAWIRDPFLKWQGGFFDDGWRAVQTSCPGDRRGWLILHGHTPPLNRLPAVAGDQVKVRKAFDRMATNARVCLDGGAALGVGVAGACLTAEGVQILYCQPSVKGDHHAPGH